MAISTSSTIPKPELFDHQRGVNGLLDHHVCGQVLPLVDELAYSHSWYRHQSFVVCSLSSPSTSISCHGISFIHTIGLTCLSPFRARQLAAVPACTGRAAISSQALARAAGLLLSASVTSISPRIQDRVWSELRNRLHPASNLLFAPTPPPVHHSTSSKTLTASALHRSLRQPPYHPALQEPEQKEGRDW